MTTKPALLPVADALDHLFGLAKAVGVETVSLAEAAGRVLREDVAALRTQPPFAASAMDGFAVRRSEALVGAELRIVGETAAGAAIAGSLPPNSAVRIFTGAPVPEGADAIALQEDVDIDRDAAGARVARIRNPLEDVSYIRRAGLDFEEGETLLRSPRRLSSEDIALAASGGRPWQTVARRPRIALLSIGDELALPGEPLGPSAIVSSNGFGVAALLRAGGGAPETYPILRDDRASLDTALRAAAGADLIVTLGGASEGEHDLAKAAFVAVGAEIGFHKIAMRPGKPLMAGRWGEASIVGLPGNPVSALICARIFLLPLLDVMLGLPAKATPRSRGILGAALGSNGPREHYMRARRVATGEELRLIAVESQDSSRLRLLADADTLIVRPPNDPPKEVGDVVECVFLRPVGDFPLP